MGSTPEERKRRLIADLTGARQEVLAAAIAPGQEEQETPFLGNWSAHDIVAHLVGWDYANLEAIEAIRNERLPAFYQQYDRDWHTFNAGLVAQHKQETLDQTTALARASHQALLAALAGLPPEVITHDFGVRSPGRRRVTIAMLLETEARDERKHAGQIRAFAARAAGGTPEITP